MKQLSLFEKPNIKTLENLADFQKHLLIRKGKHVDELKEIWLRKWNLEYPYWTDCIGRIRKEGD